MQVLITVFGALVIVSSLYAIHRWGLIAGLVVGVLMVGAYAALLNAVV